VTKTRIVPTLAAPLIWDIFLNFITTLQVLERKTTAVTYFRCAENKVLLP